MPPVHGLTVPTPLVMFSRRILIFRINDEYLKAKAHILEHFVRVAGA